MTKAIISTSANPFHFGHLDLFNKAKDIFQDVKVVIAQNSEKSDSKNTEFHLNAYQIPYEIIKNKTIADYCLENDISYIVRGIRNGVDAEYELKLDFINRELNPKVQTIFIPTNDIYSNVSSSTIRELIKYHKYDTVKKYMNEDAMWRYIQGKKHTCYFGKSCVGKTTYLKNTEVNAINVDTYLWEVSTKVHGQYETDKLREDSRRVIYGNYTTQEKLKLIHFYDSRFFSQAFWDEFFTIPTYQALDWAAVGLYWDFIPIKYRSTLKFVEITCDEETRLERIKAKGFENKIKDIDSLYQEPKIVDERITI